MSGSTDKILQVLEAEQIRRLKDVYKRQAIPLFVSSRIPP